MRKLFSYLGVFSVSMITTAASFAAGLPLPVAAPLPAKAPGHFEVIGALGVANLKADDSEMGVTSSETDKLVQTNRNTWDTFSGQLGAGYVYYFGDAQQYAEQTQWLPSMEPELNAYYLGGESAIKGDVWRFNDAEWNQMNYKNSVYSTRLMFDTALTLVSKKAVSLYAIGGVGNAWNRVGYKDSDDENDGTCPNQRLNLHSHTSSNFAWEAGAGLAYAFNNRFSLSLEYLYTDLGDGKPSSRGNTGTITEPVIVPESFDLKAQTALLGLHVSL